MLALGIPIYVAVPRPNESSQNGIYVEVRAVRGGGDMHLVYLRGADGKIHHEVFHPSTFTFACMNNVVGSYAPPVGRKNSVRRSRGTLFLQGWCARGRSKGVAMV
jgi:hypothetical protein